MYRFFCVRYVRLPFREIATSRVALLAMTAAVRVYGIEPPPAFGWRVYASFRFYRGGFLGGEPPPAFGWRVYASFRFYCGGFLG